jgi:putative ABC transport system permease protein
VTASVRAILQLGGVALIITAVLRSWWTTAAFVILMLLVAGFTSARRLGTLRDGWPALVSIAAGALPAVTAIVASGVTPLTTI